MSAKLSAARNLLIAESDAIRLLSENIGDEFERAVEILLHDKGKTVVCGIGKSGHIARKIAATFSSTGHQAVFLHPAEGAHGDLGVYSAGDTTILISKSGTTDEILCLIPTLKKFESKIIAIVGNRLSPIAEAANVVIDISFAHEADPLQIVPTTSSTVSLAVGDALAAELMARRSFTKDNFAVFHPAGQLGRNLLLRVSDVMSFRSECAIVTSNSSLRDVVIAMTNYPLGAALVLGEDDALNGIITEGDIRRALTNNMQIDEVLAKDVMSVSPKYIYDDDFVGDAVKLMEFGNSQISVLPVVSRKQVNGRNCAIGLLRLHDTYCH